MSGQPIPVGTPDTLGPLAADKIVNNPVGAAHVFGGEAPDLFVIAGSRFYPELVVFPSAGRSPDGLPVFELPKDVATPEYMNYSKPGTIFELDGKAQALWVDGGDLVHLIFDPATMAFSEASRAAMPELPRSASCIGWLSHGDGTAFTLLLSISNGVNGSPQLPGVTSSRDVNYDPYDGAGVWRGGFPYAGLYGVDFPGLLEGPAGKARLLSATDHEVRNTYQRLTWVDLGAAHGLDVIGGSSFGPLYYYSADGSTYGGYRNPVSEDGIALRHPTIKPSPTPYPNADGQWSDLIVGGEGGMYYYHFLDRFTESGQPVYSEPVYALLKQAPLYAGTLPVVSVVDWNGDGANDIVAGNSEGYVLLFVNAGSNEAPAFENGVALEAGGEPIYVQSGYRGSIQGPGESRWGYVCPTAVDWNGDGLPDIVMSDAPGIHQVFLNRGTRTEPELAAGHPIFLDGLELHGTWRVQPGVAKMGDQMAYVALDDEDQFHLYWQQDVYNVVDGGKLRLDTGDVIGANYLNAGGTGRIKIVLTDWDGDGLVDVLVGTPRHASIPDPELGLPQALGKPGSAVMLMRNTGTNNAPEYAYPEVLTFKGEPIYFGQHACSPAVAPIGPGEPGLVVGMETGRLIYFAREDIGFALLKASPDTKAP